MLERLKKLICQYADIAPEEITGETNIRSDLGLNSLELVNLAFDVEIPDRAVAGIETVDDVIALLKEYVED